MIRSERRGSLGRVRLLFALLAGISASSCDKADENTYAPPPPPEVTVANPVRKEVTSYLTYTGTVEASETVDLRARVQGFLQEVRFEPGQRVAAGDLLFQIDPREYQNAVDAATAEVAATKALLVGAENDAKLARELADQKAGPEIDAIIKAAKRDTVAANVSAAEARLQQAKLDLEYCQVVAPIGGRVTKNYVDAGNLVGRGEPTLLAEIVKVSPAYVEVDVSEEDVLAVRRTNLEADRDPKIEPGQVAPGEWRPCELRLADTTEFSISGKVDYVAPSLDAETGTLLVRTAFENADEALTPGLFATIRFPMSSAEKLLVPEAALLRDQQGRFAMVVEKDDTVAVRRVTIGVLEGSMRVVEEGLTAEDRVIVLGVLKARPGAKVTPKTQAPAAGTP